MNLRADQFPINGLVYRNSFGTSTPEVCNDNIDNDGDKLIDAADPDCQTSEVCNDNIDNDGDKLIRRRRPRLSDMYQSTNFYS